MGKPARLSKTVHAACRLAELPFTKDDPVTNGNVLGTLDEAFRDFHELDDILLKFVPEVCDKADELAGWLV